MESIQSEVENYTTSDINDYWNGLDRTWILRREALRKDKKAPLIFRTPEEASTCRERVLGAFRLLRDTMLALPSPVASKARNPVQFERDWALFRELSEFRRRLLVLNDVYDSGLWGLGDQSSPAYTLMGTFMKSAAYKRWDYARVRFDDQTPQGKARKKLRDAKRYAARKAGGVK